MLESGKILNCATHGRSYHGPPALFPPESVPHRPPGTNSGVDPKSAKWARKKWANWRKIYFFRKNMIGLRISRGLQKSPFYVQLGGPPTTPPWGLPETSPPPQNVHTKTLETHTRPPYIPPPPPPVTRPGATRGSGGPFMGGSHYGGSIYKGISHVNPPQKKNRRLRRRGVRVPLWGVPFRGGKYGFQRGPIPKVLLGGSPPRKEGEQGTWAKPSTCPLDPPLEGCDLP